MSYLPKQVCCCFLICFLCIPIHSLAEEKPLVIKGEYLVKFTSNSSRYSSSAVGENRVQLISLPSAFSSRSMNDEVASYDEAQVQHDCESIEADMGGTEYCEPNILWSISAIPNDPSYSSMYAAQKLRLPQAWNSQRGDQNILIAVLDTGVDYLHEDLGANMWVNPLEIAGNGVDDDGNGYIDDLYGIDTFNMDSDPRDDHGHGTHVAGTIGAVGDNGTGITGVTWNTKVMALKFLGSNGSGSTLNAVTAINYAISHGVDVINASFGGSFFSQALYEAVERAEKAGIIFVAAAGNSNRDNDLTPQYPSGFNLPNVVAVAASDKDDKRAWFSNYGQNSVHVMAPGANILSTLPNNGYGLLSGTSMAAPQVAGVAGLILSEYPHYSPNQIRNLLINSSEPLTALKSFTQSGGRVDADAAILLGNDPENTLPGKGNGELPEEAGPSKQVKVTLRKMKGRVSQRRFRGKVDGGVKNSPENVSLLLRNSVGTVECELGTVNLGFATHIRGKFPPGVTRARLQVGQAVSKERRVRKRVGKKVSSTNKLNALEKACSRVGVTLHQAKK